MLTKLSCDENTISLGARHKINILAFYVDKIILLESVLWSKESAYTLNMISDHKLSQVLY